jgi:hypothetical protein
MVVSPAHHHRFHLTSYHTMPAAKRVFTESFYQIERALAASLQTTYPLLMHVDAVRSSIGQCLLENDSFEAAIRCAIVRAFGWDAHRKHAEINRFVQALCAECPDQIRRDAFLEHL